MYFDSVAAALTMDGHGPYVWSAYAITLAVMSLLILSPLIRKRRLLRELRGEHRRNRQSETRSSVELS
ncbi:heme exporter protein CcmD [Congregibacter variabilis]|uniref:Heme exporter protein D n=1 Tax=Congregibacter variabilis TaxID=3081200 RepID=A0ABZ0I5E7_9GAMM|nr:heme exporter protein CcmD [Congregibacter sp. IMCC43200]